jgi:hypothetical protein
MILTLEFLILKKEMNLTMCVPIQRIFFFGNHTGAGAVSNNALTEREEESANAGSYGYGTGQSECGEDKGGCEQICDDTSGRATCLCYRGYVVAQDGVSCTGFF